MVTKTLQIKHKLIKLLVNIKQKNDFKSVLDCSLEEDIEKVFDTSNDITTLRILGDMYYKGENYPQNYYQAFYWYHKTAKLGDCKAQCHIGDMYARGKGVNRNMKKAKHWIKTSYDAGYIDAENIWVEFKLWEY